uniref:uncharacterized protein LOC101305733 isoform X2 n=1 Tax=Fragaria vesca subsp. vesca TaxID=101020 RepID=UPI0005C992CA|nr:PREDICTED: uncharacterized protein LOC101305733 isoform X2 [Fragaria vesca subsp. vesca]
MERKDNQSPQDETARILVEFLEVAITSIVFLKGIYPPGAFERRKYMNLVVQRARHPELRDYIHSAVLGLLPSIKKTPGNSCNIHYAIHSIFAYTMRQKFKDVIWRIRTILQSQLMRNDWLVKGLWPLMEWERSLEYQKMGTFKVHRPLQ